jgi:Domain of unknown function (DUF1929)
MAQYRTSTTSRRAWGTRSAARAAGRRGRWIAATLAAVSPLLGLVVASDATAATPIVAGTSLKASLFGDFNFSGPARDLSPGAYDLTLGQGTPVAASAASSMTVPTGLQVTLCSSGLASCSAYGAGSYGSLSPNDSAMFVVVTYAKGIAPSGLATGGTIYANGTQGGASLTLASGVSADLLRDATAVANDSASSVAVKDGNVALLCADAPATTSPSALGTCWTYGAGKSDLSAAANDKASFAAVVASAGTNVNLFPHPALAGTAAPLGPGVYDLTGTSVGVRHTSSMSVPAGLAAWLCDGKPGTCRWYPAGTYDTVTPDDSAVTAVVVRMDTRQLPTGASLYGHPGTSGTSLTLASGGQADLTATSLARDFSSANVASGHVLAGCTALPATPGATMGNCFLQQPGAANAPAGFDDAVQLIAVGPSSTATGGGGGGNTPPPATGTATKPLPAAAEPAPAPRATIYKDNLSGPSVTLGPGVYNAVSGELGAVGNDAVSSIVVPSGLTVWLCANGGIGADAGICKVATAGTYDVNSAVMSGMNDQASTVVIDTGNGRSGDEGAIAYKDTSFSGASENFPGGGGYDVFVNGYFNSAGNDSISSLVVREGFRAFACQNGISHSATTPANCFTFGPGRYASMPAGFNDIVSYLAVYPTVGLDPAKVGRWTKTTDIGIGVRAGTVLPTGKVVVWETGGSQVFDPITTTAGGGAAQPSGQDLFCSTHVMLPNGNIVAVATGGGGNPVKTGAEYSAANNSWTAIQPSNFARYYPSLLQLSNGSLFLAGGNDVFGKTTGVNNAAITTPEVYENGSWRSLPNAKIPFSNLRGDTNDSAFWPWLTQTANGDVLYAGPDTGMHMITPTGTGSLRSVGQRDGTVRTYGSFAQYNSTKMLVTGGSNSVASSKVIDFTGTNPVVSTTADMGVGRRQANLTVLADGTVLETGGNSNGAEQIDHDAMVLSAERWSPSTGTWNTMAPMARSRQYHSIGLLLPDARVLVAGESQPPYRDTTVQYFSPPYLFNSDGTAAARPSITSAPASVGYGAQFSVATSGGTVGALHLIKLSSVTHSTNFTQKLVPLSFTGTGGTLSVTAPSNRNLAPPGAYMLFAVNSAGVPSVASIVNLA